MTNDNVMRMVRESGMTFILGQPHQKVLEQLTRFAELVAAEEREACASILDANALKCTTIAGPILEANAFAIRARGNDAS